MKKILLSIFCLAVLYGCTTQEEPEPTTKLDWFTNSAWSPEYLNGQVKSIVQKAYWVTEENDSIIQGALITDKERDSIGWVYDLILEFGGNGLVTRSSRINENGEVIDDYDFLFEADPWRYMKVREYKKDTLAFVYVFKNDSAGRIIRMDRFRMPEDTLIFSYDLLWDEAGNWIGGHFTTYTGEKGWSHKMGYNEAGLVVYRENFNPEGEKASWQKYEYDERGFNTRWQGFRADTMYMDLAFKYPEVDEKGNWLKMVTIDKGKPAGMDVRTIEYY